ncbi:conserved hypothetical protein [Uncinocarpus reesii 1704]|uniref:Threonine/serine exporter-like N-terminal domain-containing protein n=1 Tax=Uncinocarpus reesii (strain UAMH 1704) TaxID=336963 RepID=C4JKZ2_UNCRE|nr:uncharacterized protein UREG_00180 [Uncinocarpus reesii 1704]EEP75334.1 conserved hypothetical protein [Uncinocarpus reesii 1704]
MAGDHYIPMDGFPSAPTSGESSRAPSPLGIGTAPLHSVLRRDSFSRNSGQRSKELRWSSPVGDAPDDSQRVSSQMDFSQPPPRIPPAAHLYSCSPYRGGVSSEYSPQVDAEQHVNGELSNSARRKGKAVHSAYEKARRLAARVHRPSFARRTSLPNKPTNNSSEGDMSTRDVSRMGEDQDEAVYTTESYPFGTSEAHNIVRRMSRPDSETLAPGQPAKFHRNEARRNGERNMNDWEEPHGQYRGSILFELLKLYHHGEHGEGGGGGDERRHSSASTLLPVHEPPSRGLSGQSTPRHKLKWYDKSRNVSSSSVNTLLPETRSPSLDGLKRSKSSNMLSMAAKKLLPRPRLEDQIHITVHIAEIISRQRYLMKLCRALMQYGAPTHRLEEYMSTTAKVLQIDAQFLYMPDCMFFSFGDATTHTTELKLLKYPQGVDLGRLADVHEIYKEVVHDIIGVEEAMQRLDETMHRKDKYNKWWLIGLYGCASATVGPYAFGAGAQDMPMAFLLGCILAGLKYLVVPHSPLYSNVFELTAALVTSFLARALGSIRAPGGEAGRLFCFPALAQSAVALILRGYMVLCSSLELQSKHMLAGSVRLVFAIIYSLVLGFGMMLGTAFYGGLDRTASSAYACSGEGRFGPLGEAARKFPSVVLFTVCLAMINQAKWKQTPVMVGISLTGYVVTFFSGKRFAQNPQLASVLGAFAIGVLGNLYSRLRHGLAAAAILPAIFVQVPSGLASSGSLLAGLAVANAVNESARQAGGAGDGRGAGAGGQRGRDRGGRVEGGGHEPGVREHCF